MKRTKEELEKEINDRLFYFYAQTDGTFNFPNSAEGDLLKLVNEYMMKPELRKDKERLDWLMENDCLRDWIDHGVAYGLNEGREYIDAVMGKSE